MGTQKTSGEISLIVGLGNPGARYQNTRHNIGFRVVDQLLKTVEPGAERVAIGGSELWRWQRNSATVLCLKPGSFMNRSGGPTAQVVERFEIALERLLVIYDDLDLPPGKLRLRRLGSSGGHQGVENIIEALAGEDFHRLRIGIGQPGNEPWENYVLEPFASAEAGSMAAAIKRAAQACECWIDHGMVRAMDRYNAYNTDPGEEKPGEK